MGLARRTELQVELETLLANLNDSRIVEASEHVSFQPDEASVLKYPHIVYSRDPAYIAKADNIVYRHMDHYVVTYIDRKPDNPVLDILVRRLYCSHSASFVADGLHHDVFDLYH